MAGLHRNDDCGLGYFAPLVLDRLSADYAVCGKTPNSATTSGTSLKSLIMPSITLGVGIAAVIARFTRSSIIEVLKEDYVRTARAKGIKEKVVIWKHVFRNSMIPS